MASAVMMNRVLTWSAPCTDWSIGRRIRDAVIQPTAVRTTQGITMRMLWSRDVSAGRWAIPYSTISWPAM